MNRTPGLVYQFLTASILWVAFHAYTLEPGAVGTAPPTPGKVPLSDYFFLRHKNQTWDAGKEKCDTQNNGIFAMAWIDSEGRHDATHNLLRLQAATSCFWIDLIKEAGSSQWSWNRVKTLQEGDFNRFHDPSWLTQVHGSAVVACVAPRYNFTWLTNVSDEFAGVAKHYSICQAMDPDYQPVNSG